MKNRLSEPNSRIKPKSYASDNIRYCQKCGKMVNKNEVKLRLDPKGIKGYNFYLCKSCYNNKRENPPF